MTSIQANFELRVTSVLSRGAKGGVIFAGLTEANQRFIAVCSYSVLADSSLVHKGQTWSVTGTLVARGGQDQILASTACLLRPSGQNLIAWIANSPLCAGIGEVKARKLYDRFGATLIDLIESENVDRLREVVSDDAALALCRAFSQDKVAGALAWLDALGIHRFIGQKLVSFYGEAAQSKIEENPYRLTSFAEKWRVVDGIARQRFGVQESDPRRLEAAIEEVLSSAIAAGHTCVPAPQITARLALLLGNKALAQAALDSRGDAYEVLEGTFQARGAHLIERCVAARLHSMLEGEVDKQASLLRSTLPSEDDVNACIDAFERQQGDGFILTLEQRNAVKTSVMHRVSLILGGAGTGKTTVLKALYSALELAEGVSIFQLALAGRAAQRMSEATGRESMTIAAFLHKVDTSTLGTHAVIVVDEFSMVDVILMYRLLEHLPLGVRLVLVGDPSQLPPIGPGLVLHALVGHSAVPQTELKVTKRQAISSGIPSVAAAVRAHTVPLLERYRGKEVGVSYIQSSEDQLHSTVLDLYTELGGDTHQVRVLSVTRNGMGGVIGLNAAIHQMTQKDAEMVWCFDDEFGVVAAQSMDKISIRVGDSVMFTRNDYKTGLRNGSLGTVVQSLPVTGPESTSCVCNFEGVEYRLKTAEVYALTHAYAITVHKSQGSQFERVIIPVRQSRLLDQALIYTAITRAIEQVVIVGDMNVVRSAIAAPASASRRRVLLPQMLSSVTKSNASYEKTH